MSNSSHTRAIAGSSHRPSHAPVPYRQAPLAYKPTKYCLCAPRAKAPMWISWSDNNPGRRYLACPKGRVSSSSRSCIFEMQAYLFKNVNLFLVEFVMHGQSCRCGFFQWVDEETSPFLTQLLLDLRNDVWTLEAHNRILDRNGHGWRSPNLKHIEATASTWVQPSVSLLLKRIKMRASA